VVAGCASKSHPLVAPLEPEEECVPRRDDEAPEVVNHYRGAEDVESDLELREVYDRVLGISTRGRTLATRER